MCTMVKVKGLLIASVIGIASLLLVSCDDDSGGATGVSGVDITPPEVAITQPTSEEAECSVVITVDIKDASSIGKVELYIDNQLFSVLNQAPWEFTIKTEESTLQSNYFVLAYDSQGNIGQSETRSITIHPFTSLQPAIRFNGTNGYARVPASDNLSFGRKSYTIEAWVKPESVGGDWRLVISKANSNNDLDYYFGIERRRTFEFATKDFLGQVEDGIDAEANTWYHITAVNDVEGGEARLFVNGFLNDLTLLGSNFSTNNADLIIGGRFTNGGLPIAHQFHGLIRELRVWNRALAQSEIQENMAKILQGDEADLVAYWPMSEIIDNQIPDASGNGHDGVIFGNLSISNEPVACP